MGEFNSVDDFLNHKGSEGASGKRLKSWAKDPGYMNFWLHKGQMPCSVHFHRIPELVKRTDKDTREEKKNVWGRQHVCYEDESILKKQRFRTSDGRREHPPTKCGICRMLEAIRELVNDGELQDTDVLFEFKGSDNPSEDTLLHAGGMTNLWRFDTMSEDDKNRLKKHGIFASKVWGENAAAKLSYVFAGVNHDAPGDGLQIAIQTQLLGDKVKRTIRNEIASKDGDDGNPFIRPYCIRFVYKAEEKKFDDKYDALRIDRLKLTPEIEKLISGERPDISRFTRKFNQKEMRAMLEKHATPIAKAKLPWEAIFNVPDYDVDPNAEKAPASARPAATTTTTTTTSSAAAKPAAPAEEWDDPCEDCGAPMKKGQTKCGKCGANYASDDAAPAAAAPAKVAETEDPNAPVYDQDVPF